MRQMPSQPPISDDLSQRYPLLASLQGPDDLRAMSIDRLEELAGQIRQAIVDQVSVSGGHLAPNLGVVELTIALHRVFDFSTDRLLLDVGHQCYPHKLLTGRLGLLPKLRTADGMSGFPNPAESDYDLFAVGHAGTAISTAVGMARGDDILAGGPGQSDRKAVALVGDASIVNGVALEGLNNAGTLRRQLLVVLNDNGMSIAQPQGAVASYFDRVRVSPAYGGIKKQGKRVLDHVPGGSVIERLYHRGSDTLKALIAHEHMFEHFGLVCVGPIDGHDLRTLIDMLGEVRAIDRPVLLHVKTTKGKGVDFCEDDATAFHSPKPFKINGCRVEVGPAATSRAFTDGFADAMGELMVRDEKVVAVTAAMPDGTGLSKLQDRFGERVIDTGICESHALDMCAGMAKAGLKPFFAVYSTFAQRAVDQLFQEAALQGLPVRLCLDRAGYVGGDGAVHHGFMDIAMTRPMPGAVMLAPSDEPTLRGALDFLHGYEAGPSLMRYPRDAMADPPMHDAEDCPPFKLGRAHLLHVTDKRRTPDVAILALGPLCTHALTAARQLGKAGHNAAVYDARFAFPADDDLAAALLDQDIPLLTVEDHAAAGGFGAGLIEGLTDKGLDASSVVRLAHPHRWVGPDSRGAQLAAAGLDADGIADAALQLITPGETGRAGKPRLRLAAGAETS
jgi:1-deoxy-D-xylulose-5-phosphate synthase